MSLAVVYSRAQLGVEAPLVSVEVHLSNGLPALSIVGLPETAVRESKDRVRSALLNSGFEFPAKRITVNLAPADLPKQGGRYDLAIALGILAASGQIPLAPLSRYEFVAELALGGQTRPVNGILPGALAATDHGRHLVCAAENGAEAALGNPGNALVADCLLAACRQLHDDSSLDHAVTPDTACGQSGVADMCDIQGQAQARRALEVAAAGAHNLLFIGPPGTGKTLLASRLPGILPALDEREALETAAVNSLGADGFDYRRWKHKPFRAPHHTASAAALVGGGSQPHPGEISLAHHGVLFLDELPEFKRHVLEALREPLETGRVTISRAARQTEFPARFQLVAAMNPCPCGYQGDRDGRCHCSADQVRRYQQRLSGPLLDRIDLQVEVPRIDLDPLAPSHSESSASIRQRVEQARSIQAGRGYLNARLPTEQIRRHCQLDASQRQLLDKVTQRFRLSPRAVHRVLRVARSIADLAGSPDIAAVHLQEAIAYRCLDRSTPALQPLQPASQIP